MRPRGGGQSPPRTAPLGLARVHGRSMLPTLRPGDRLLVSYVVRPRPGDVVVAQFVDGTLTVKRAASRRRTRGDDEGWWLLSDNPTEGVDSRHRGVVPASDVRAVALLRVWPRPRLLRVPRPRARAG